MGPPLSPPLQACRLPYALIVDGTIRELGDVQYLLSPQASGAALPPLHVALLRSLLVPGPWAHFQPRRPACKQPHPFACASFHCHPPPPAPQDLAAVELVPELIQAGVTCFKIEGAPRRLARQSCLRRCCVRAGQALRS